LAERVDRLANSVNIAEARTVGRHMLARKPTPQLDTDILLGSVLSDRREALLTRGELRLTPRQESEFRGLIERRANGEPTAYLIGFKSWFGLDIRVTPNVLIPRPETELLVETAIRRAQETGAATIVDVGTGSGAIAIALARALPDARILAIDNSHHALVVASSNLRGFGLDRRVELMNCDLLEKVKEAPDLVVANLPYIPIGDRECLTPEVRHEPEGALFGGADGLDEIRRLLRQVITKGWESTILLEIDPRQVDTLGEFVGAHMRGRKTTVIQDLSGRDRVVRLEAYNRSIHSRARSEPINAGRRGSPGPELPESDSSTRETAVKVLRADGVIAIPTDTVYGLIARYDSAPAVERIYRIKGRPEDKPLPILLGAASDCERVALDLPTQGLSLIERFWPGALTIIWKAKDSVLPRVTAGTGTVGMRVPAHGPLLDILRAAGPVASTSSNLSGERPARSPGDVWRMFGSEIDLVVSPVEQTESSGPSTVIDLTTEPYLLRRKGAVAVAAIEDVLGVRIGIAG